MKNRLMSWVKAQYAWQITLYLGFLIGGYAQRMHGWNGPVFAIVSLVAVITAFKVWANRQVRQDDQES